MTFLYTFNADGLFTQTEITVLWIALVLFIVGMVIAIYFRNDVMLLTTGFLWFIPIFIIDNIFIALFCVIMIIMLFSIVFFKKKGDDYE